MYILWLILFVAVVLWACYYYRYSYQEFKRKAAEEAEREEKKRENILFGTAIQPKHAHPKLKRWSTFGSLRRFFADFDEFGVIANDLGPIKDSPWRLQELEDTRLRTSNSVFPKRGRRYEVFYNQQPVGSLEIATSSDYTTEKPRVRGNILVREAKLIPLYELSGFLTSVAALLSGATGDECAETKSKVETALTRAHSDVKRSKGADSTPRGLWKWIQRERRAPEVVVEVSFIGSAATYINLRVLRSLNDAARTSSPSTRRASIPEPNDQPAVPLDPGSTQAQDEQTRVDVALAVEAPVEKPGADSRSPNPVPTPEQDEPRVEMVLPKALHLPVSAHPSPAQKEQDEEKRVDMVISEIEALLRGASGYWAGPSSNT
jgi:hypothetical protein